MSFETLLLSLRFQQTNTLNRSDHMAITLNVNDDFIDELAEAIASKINMNGNNGAVAEEEEKDEFDAAEETKEITLTDMQDAIKEAVGKHGKEKIKALVKKTAGVDKVVDIAKDKYQAVLDGLKKVK